MRTATRRPSAAVTMAMATPEVCRSPTRVPRSTVVSFWGWEGAGGGCVGVRTSGLVGCGNAEGRHDQQVLDRLCRARGPGRHGPDGHSRERTPIPERAPGVGV